MHDEYFVYNLTSMVSYDTWEKEWDSADNLSRSKAIAACQRWLDTEYPGAEVISPSYSEPCVLRFVSQEQKTHFILKWS